MASDLTPDTKDLPGPLDAFETLKPGERHWTLQAGDPLAPPTMIFWARLARRYGAEIFPEKELKDIDEQVARIVSKLPPLSKAQQEEMLVRARNTEEMAWDFDAWRKGQSAIDERTAGQMEGETAEEAKWRLAHFNQLTYLIERLHNSIAELAGVGEGLIKLDKQKYLVEIGTLSITVQTLKQMTAHITPKRRGEQ